MTQIFVLKDYSIEFELDENREKFLPLSYPFALRKEILGYFSSLQKAESGIHDYIVLNNIYYMQHTIHSFIITEYVVDDEDNDYGFAPFETRRSYLANGKLEETCLVSERGFEVESGKFWGRKPEEIRFKEGDIVELPHAKLPHGDGIVPCIVVGLPLTAEYYQKRNDECFKKTGEKGQFYGDWSDDFYMLIPYLSREGEVVTVADIVCPECSPYPLYPVDCLDIFPPSIPVSDEIKEALQALYHAFNTERTERFEKLQEEGLK